MTGLTRDALAQFLAPDGKRFYPLSKLCRLCGDQKGPFMDIHGSETSLDAKMGVLPVSIVRADELPHRICFLCSAKVSEFSDFVGRCLKTHAALREAIGESPEPAGGGDVKSAVKLERDVELVVKLTRLEDDPVLRTRLEDDDCDVQVVVSSDSDEDNSDAGVSGAFSKVNVAGLHPVYTCDRCDAVLVKKQLRDHVCRRFADQARKSTTSVAKRKREPSPPPPPAKKSHEEIESQSPRQPQALPAKTKKKAPSYAPYANMTYAAIDSHLGRLLRKMDARFAACENVPH